jgi:mono/diheme cytochrome c family protein
MKLRTILASSMLFGVLASSGPVEQTFVAAAAAAPERASFDAALVAKGAELAAIGNCRSCHTKPGGEPFAGGLPLSTPFGTIHSTNITPDPDTGIGRWTSEDFLRAMHEGVDRAGRHLYPAFPYDHFTRVTALDVAAIYAFMMTREPVRAEVPANRLRLPAGFRPAIAVWKALYFEPGVYRRDPSKSAIWNRGAYLVDGLAHCGACHTPRNALGAENKRQDLGGGEAERWHASSLTETSPAPVPWSADALYDYLRRGHEQRHGIAAGPMTPVVHNLSGVAEDDVRAIAVYVASRMQRPESATAGVAEAVVVAAKEREASAATATTSGNAASAVDGADVFTGACAICHGAGPASLSAAPVALGLTTSINAPDPRNAIHIVLEGLWPEPGAKGALMPGFAGELTDRQVIALVDYLRARFTDRPAWSDVPERVRELRQAMQSEP